MNHFKIEINNFTLQSGSDYDIITTLSLTDDAGCHKLVSFERGNEHLYLLFDGLKDFYEIDGFDKESFFKMMKTMLFMVNTFVLDENEIMSIGMDGDALMGNIEFVKFLQNIGFKVQDGDEYNYEE